MYIYIYMYVYTYVCMYIYIYIYIYSEGAVWPVRGTTTYVSSYCYRVCIIYVCPHTTVYATRGPCGPFEVLLHMCPHTAMYICLHTTISVSSYCYKYVSAGASLRLGKTMKRKMRIRAVWTRVLRRL